MAFSTHILASSCVLFIDCSEKDFFWGDFLVAGLIVIYSVIDCLFVLVEAIIYSSIIYSIYILKNKNKVNITCSDIYLFGE